jgi:hypothetical protein
MGADQVRESTRSGDRPREYDHRFGARDSSVALRLVGRLDVRLFAHGPGSVVRAITARQAQDLDRRYSAKASDEDGRDAHTKLDDSRSGLLIRCQVLTS